MKDLITWNEKYAVHLDSMDGEHKKLFALINDLNRALFSGSASGESGKILEELLRYTEYHFRHEEKMLAENNYSQLEQHKAAHAVLIERVKDLEERFERGEEITVEMLTLMQHWIGEHILTVDHHYSLELGACPV
ncbi:MAG: bacteriohemerythrin [Spirochaetales bacterium]|nr:bacteriohemerythrin [Spirochaetales bacterium]